MLLDLRVLRPERRKEKLSTMIFPLICTNQCMHLSNAKVVHTRMVFVLRELRPSPEDRKDRPSSSYKMSTRQFAGEWDPFSRAELETYRA